MKNQSEAFKKIFGTLTIVSAIMFVFALIITNNIPARDPLFEFSYALMWVGLGATPLFAVLWVVFKINADDAFAEENRIKWEEQRKIEEAKKEQKKLKQRKHMKKFLIFGNMAKRQCLQLRFSIRTNTWRYLLFKTQIHKQ